MRIVGGRHKGRALQAPAGRVTRPTADRAREAVFNVLAHGVDGPGLDGARVVDVFAGTGALGLEALSRGAAHATFVECDRRALAALRANIRTLGEDGNCAILAHKAAAIGPAPGAAAHYAFLDAPYDQGLTVPALDALAAGGWLADGAVILAEVAANEALDPPAGFRVLKEKAYGAARAVSLRYGGGGGG